MPSRRRGGAGREEDSRLEGAARHHPLRPETVYEGGATDDDDNSDNEDSLGSSSGKDDSESDAGVGVGGGIDYRTDKHTQYML